MHWAGRRGTNECCVYKPQRTNPTDFTSKKSNQRYSQTVLVSRLSNNISPLSVSNRYESFPSASVLDALSFETTLMSTRLWHYETWVKTSALKCWMSKTQDFYQQTGVCVPIKAVMKFIKFRLSNCLCAQMNRLAPKLLWLSWSQNIQQPPNITHKSLLHFTTY